MTDSLHNTWPLFVCGVKGHTVYTIDLMTILQLLREFRRSGILRAELPTGLPRLKQPCLVFIELLHGEVTACHVKDTRGKTLMANQEALEAITGIGKLNWIFDALSEQEVTDWQQIPDQRPDVFLSTSPRNTGPLSTSPALPVPEMPSSPFRSSPVPRQLVQLNYAQINTWPRRYRQVYVLVDGVRSAEKIAAILSQPSQIVEEVLRELQAVGAIILE